MVGAGEGDQLWGSGRGAIAGCHCSVLWWGQGRVTNFGGVRRAIAGCHCSVLAGDDQPTFGEWADVVPLLGAIAGCHCSVLSGGKGKVTANFGGVDVVPLQGAIVVCYGLGGGWRPTLGEWTVDVAGCHCSVLWLGEHFFFALTTQKLVFAIWGLCW